jgi:allophanate hydrolase
MPCRMSEDILRQLEDMSVIGLRRRYEQREVVPGDVIKALYGKIDAASPAWIHLRDLDDALTAASDVERRRAAGELLPLYGIPFGVKDNIDVAGMPTTAACREFSYVPAVSAHSVALLERAGAICLGKTNLDQFATGLSGTRSPYGACSSVGNPLYISGGSSSGSAVAVAAGHVSFALGTDTGGSGRIPAGFNGVVGVKPTVGRVSTRGVVPNCRTLDCVSVFALGVDDGMTVLDVMQGFDAQDPFSRFWQTPVARQRERGGFRFGILRPAEREWFGMPSCAALYDAACARMVALGGTPVEIDFAPYLEAGRLLFDGPWIAERNAALASLLQGDYRHLLDVTRTVIAAAQNCTGTAVFDGLHRLAFLRRVVDQQFAAMDFLMVPTAPRPFTIAEMTADPICLNSQLGYYSYFANLLDLCAIAVPNGALPSGVPMGVTLLAPAWADENVAEIARLFDRQRLEVMSS